MTAHALDSPPPPDFHRIATVIPFPPRRPFAVHVIDDGDGWLVVCRDHGWRHGDQREAIADAKAIAAGFDVAIRVKP